MSPLAQCCLGPRAAATHWSLHLLLLLAAFGCPAASPVAAAARSSALINPVADALGAWRLHTAVQPLSSAGTTRSLLQQEQPAAREIDFTWLGPAPDSSPPAAPCLLDSNPQLDLMSDSISAAEPPLPPVSEGPPTSAACLSQGAYLRYRRVNTTLNLQVRAWSAGMPCSHLRSNCPHGFHATARGCAAPRLRSMDASARRHAMPDRTVGTGMGKDANHVLHFLCRLPLTIPSRAT